jgi:hypothetical protein
MGLRITTSRFPTTTNCVPAFKPNRSRTSSGMTTCPLEDMRILAKLSIDRSFPTREIIGYSGGAVNGPKVSPLCKNVVSEDLRVKLLRRGVKKLWSN